MLRDKLIKALKENEDVLFLSENEVMFDGAVEDALSDAAIWWDDPVVDNQRVFQVKDANECINFKVIPNDVPEKEIIIL